MNTFTVRIDGKQYTSVFPFKYGQYLDEQLDYAILEVIRTKQKHFAPTTPIEINITSTQNDTTENNTLRYIISSDNSRESPLGSGDYRHELTVIEPTKLLEGIPVETLCFTQAGGRNIWGIVPTVEQYRRGELIDDTVYSPSFYFGNLLDITTFRTPAPIGYKFRLPDLRNPNDYVYGGVAGGGDSPIYVQSRDSQKIVGYVNKFGIVSPTGGDDTRPLEIEILAGINTITYEFYSNYSMATETLTFTVFGMENTKPLIPWTIESV